MRIVIAHGHIFKNAGTSFDWALERNFGEAFCDHRDDKSMRREGASYLTQYLLDNSNIKAISSHHLCDTSAVEGIAIIPFYIIRHPIERILSVYNFERKQDSSTPGAIAAKKYNFKDYVQWRMDPKVNGTIRNYQTNYLAGVRAVKRPHECSLEDFNAAMKKVESSLVGLVERFDTSMIRFEEALRKRNIEVDLSYIKQNVSSERRKTDGDEISYIAEALGGLFKEVLKNNAFDMALHSAVNQLMDKEHIEDYADKLADFKNRCSRLS